MPFKEECLVRPSGRLTHLICRRQLDIPRRGTLRRFSGASHEIKYILFVIIIWKLFHDLLRTMCLCHVIGYC